MQVLKAKYIFDEAKLYSDHVIVIDNDKQSLKLLPEVEFIKQHQNRNCQIINYGDGVITSGFVDLQINGCGGVLFNNDISINTLEIMYQNCCLHGTKYFMPTLISTSIANIFKSLDVVSEWVKVYGIRRGVIGLHLEGPFISKNKPGIHMLENIIMPQDDILRKIVQYSKLFKIKMTIAVEHFTHEQIQYLIANKIILSVGHSNASYQEVIEAKDIGLSSATHTFNAMSGLTARNSGVIGAVLNTDLFASVIVDLLHVACENIEILYKIKTADFMYLVSDAVTPSGIDLKDIQDDSFKSFKLFNKDIYLKNGRCVDSGDVLAGAYLTLKDAINNCINICQIPLQDVLKMAIVTPSKVVGMYDEISRLSYSNKTHIIYYATDTGNILPLRL